MFSQSKLDVRHNNKSRASSLILGLLMGAAALVAGGCDTNDFINPAEPRILRKGSKPLLVPILDTIDRSVEEPDTAFTNATDPTPADLVVSNSDYRIGKNDLVSVSIFDLLGEGTGETVKTARVSETGTISLPFISPVHVEGLSEQEAEQAIIKAYQDAKLIRNARVSVTVAEARARTFSIQGNVGAAGEYQITQADFRLLNAMVLGKAPAAQGTQYLYVLRKKTADNPASATQPSSPADTGGGVTNPAAAPATSPTVPNDLLAPHTQAAPLAAPKLMMQAPATETTTPGAAPSTANTGATSATGPAATQNLLAPGADEGATGVVDGKPLPTVPDAAAAPATGPTSAPFAFNDLQAPTDTRIIRIPIEPLRTGDLRYNIVVRPGDMILVPDPITGEYYMGGHVARVGVYSLTGRQITLKQAWVSAGGGDQEAIPERTEVIRRIGQNKEVFARVDLGQVLNGSQPDIFLKPNDIVQVGTNMYAPFLAALRNGFRITYGFGFLYDRNFDTSNNNSGGF